MVEERVSVYWVLMQRKDIPRGRSWWLRFFFDEDGNWLGLKDEHMLRLEASERSSDEDTMEGENFEALKRRAEAIIELREAEQDARNEENQLWEDWLMDGTHDVHNSSWSQEGTDGNRKFGDLVQEDLIEIVPGRGLIKPVRDMVLGLEVDDMLYED